MSSFTLDHVFDKILPPKLNVSFDVAVYIIGVSRLCVIFNTIRILPFVPPLS